MQIIDININNIDNEHICCSISEKKGENCVFSKKAWMKNNFDKGLVFKRFDVRGKAFIERKCMVSYYCGQLYIY